MTNHHSLITAICALTERDRLRAVNADLLAALEDLFAMVQGETPRSECQSMKSLNRWFWKHSDLSYGYQVQVLVCIAVVLMTLPWIAIILELTND